jgi:hypothetical protein
MSRKLVSRAINPLDNQGVPVCLPRTGLIVLETIVADAQEVRPSLNPACGTKRSVKIGCLAPLVALR